MNTSRKPNRRAFHSQVLTTGMIAGNILTADEPLDGYRLPATARNVIFLFMSGGPSQVDTFDEKPQLVDLAGENVP